MGVSDAVLRARPHLLHLCPRPHQGNHRLNIGAENLSPERPGRGKLIDASQANSIRRLMNAERGRRVRDREGLPRYHWKMQLHTKTGQLPPSNSMPSKVVSSPARLVLISLGRNSWKEDPTSSEYDYVLLQKRLQQLREARAAGDLSRVLFLLRISLSRTFAHAGNPEVRPPRPFSCVDR